jgi:hypothetical protein
MLRGIVRCDESHLTAQLTSCGSESCPVSNDTILDCSIFLYRSEEDALAGADYGASGFLVGVPIEPVFNHWALYAVTNSRVIEDGYPVVRLNSKEGGLKTIPLDVNSWIHHPDGDDVAIASIALDRETHKFKYLDTDEKGSFFITETSMVDLRLGAGDETFMIDRFGGRDEKQSNRPVARFGHFASATPELINQGDDRRQFLQESFLVETHSIPGFGGSPVFVSIPADRIDAPSSPEPKARYREHVRKLGLGSRERFLGIDWGNLGMDRNGKHLPGLANIVPAMEIIEAPISP